MRDELTPEGRATTGTAEPFDLALALNDFFNATQDGNEDAGQIAQDEIIDAFATLTRQLAEAQQREQWLDEQVNAHGSVQLRRWNHDGRRLFPAFELGGPILLVRKMAERGGADESLSEALDAFLASIPTTPDREG